MQNDRENLERLIVDLYDAGAIKIDLKGGFSTTEKVKVQLFDAGGHEAGGLVEEVTDERGLLPPAPLEAAPCPSSRSWTRTGDERVLHAVASLDDRPHGRRRQDPAQGRGLEGLAGLGDGGIDPSARGVGGGDVGRLVPTAGGVDLGRAPCVEERLYVRRHGWRGTAVLDAAPRAHEIGRAHV